MEPTDPRQLRISDTDRHQVAELLREAAGEGRLDVEELEERLEATYAAKTYGDLVPLTVDLPTGNVPAPLAGSLPVSRSSRTPHVGGPRHDGSYAVMSETKRTGAWTLPAEHTAVAVMGSVVLDLRDAELGRESVINAHTVMGSVEVVVDAWTRVELSGVPVMGAFQMGRESVGAELSAESPVVRIKGFALMGSVEVKRKGEPRQRRKLLGH
ncbi:DUF1707 SHOCT-like domain-containing protein [Nocardioides marmoraquaticus]